MQSPPETAARRERLDPEARRTAIVAATIAYLAGAEPGRWTLRQVAREAGVAPSLITHFFGSWSALLLAAYRALADRFAREVASLASAEGVPAADRLRGYIERYFAEDWTGPQVSGVYIAFWSLARGEPGLREEMTRFSALMQSSLAGVVAELARGRAGAGDPAETAATLETLMSGLWYEMAVNPGSISAEAAVHRCRSYLRLALGGLEI